MVSNGHRNLNDRIKLKGHFKFQHIQGDEGSLLRSRDPEVRRKIKTGQFLADQDARSINRWSNAGCVSR